MSAKLLSHRIRSVSRAANSSSVFWEPIQCSHNPSLSWQVGNIVSKFPVLSQTHGRPRFQSMTSCEKVRLFVPMMKYFNCISCHGNVQSTSPGGPTMERSIRRNTISILHKSCLYTFVWAAPKQATEVTVALKCLKRSYIATFLFTKYGLFATSI